MLKIMRFKVVKYHTYLYGEKEPRETRNIFKDPQLLLCQLVLFFRYSLGRFAPSTVSQKQNQLTSETSIACP